MSIELELQLASNGPGVPAQSEFQHWLDTCFPSEDGNVLVRVVDTTEIAALNLQYRHKEGPTNVLSFPFELPEGMENDHLGDLVICAAVIRAEANAQGKPPENHWAHMLVHGVLHLQGYDHQNETEAGEMETLEVDLLARLNIANPYE